MNPTTPVFAIIAAHLLLADERMAPNKAIGIVLSFLGVVVLLGGDPLGGENFALTGMLGLVSTALAWPHCAGMGLIGAGLLAIDGRILGSGKRWPTSPSMTAAKCGRRRSRRG
ncbi:MAG: hypothetical protein DI556_20885 [Rhodovulum sulfidophilum]|uniref:EamA domain-containing protein n=1 Tax=Rhodovulum sulfidophilum TaxID=35806 RepID=A0A2W5Q4E2_RHOSU|nr:MAG: hypothetical protein DI556_20885 [Rhodovulum sulfidophilum]